MKKVIFATALIASASIATGAFAGNGSELQRGTMFSGPYKGQMVVYDKRNPSKIWSQSELASAGVDIWKPQAVAAHTGLNLPEFQGGGNVDPDVPDETVSW